MTSTRDQWCGMDGDPLQGIARDIGKALVAMSVLTRRLLLRADEQRVLLPEARGIDDALTESIVLTRELLAQVHGRRRDGASREAEAAGAGAPAVVTIELRGASTRSRAEVVQAIRNVARELGGKLETAASGGGSIVIRLSRDESL